MILTIVIGLFGIFTINTFFFAIPYLMPRLDISEILSYQIFGNFLFFFYLILPKYYGRFDFTEIQNSLSNASIPFADAKLLPSAPIKGGRRRRKKN